jgi:hypothetical protein
VQSFPSFAHAVPFATSFDKHTPDPLHVSGFVQSVAAGSPHAVPTASWFDRQTPAPLQVSGSVHSVLLPSPQAEPAGRAGCVQTPVALHVSVVHAFPSSVHSVPFAK